MDRKLTTDVVIVGAGLAGLVAAIEARAHGADVLVLDKLPDPERWTAISPVPGGVGNDTWRSGGGGLSRFDATPLIEHLVGGAEELAAGRDPVDILVDRHVQRGWGEVDTRFLRTYCSRIFGDCRWLRDDIRLPYDAHGRTVKGVGVGLLKWLHKTAAERGVRMMFSTRAMSLLLDGPGNVTGLRARSGEESFDIAASAVILASGGFQGDRDMMMDHAGRTIAEDVIMVGSPENTGDGLRMAVDAGAATRHLDVCHIRTTDIYFGQGPSRYLAHIYPLGIYFNRDFERFVDEGVADSDTIANAIALQPGCHASLVFDDKARQLHPREFQDYPRGEQVIRSANTIPELAEKMHISTEGLVRLVEEFNTSIDEGRAGGADVPKTVSVMRIDTPPFHGFHPVRPAVNHTLGGLAVDGDTCQVVDGQGRPIAGLYAAGTVMNWANGRAVEIGGVTSFKGSYHAGATSGAGVALVSGRLAAQKATARAANDAAA